MKTVCKTGEVTATVQIAKWVYQQIEKANGQVWVMEKVLRHLDPEWTQGYYTMSATGFARSTAHQKATGQP